MIDNPVPSTPTRISVSQKKLLIIFALFFVPLSLATAWYTLMPATYQPSGGTNNGQLIVPAYPVQPFEQHTLKGEKWSVANLETIWTVVHVLDGPCDAACSKSLYNTRQIRIALGKDIDRVQRVILVKTPEIATAEAKMWASHPDMQVVIGHSAHSLAAQIRQQQTDPANTLYLIDPLGNLMMRFDPNLEPKLFMKDLRKLLRLSQIG